MHLVVEPRAGTRPVAALIRSAQRSINLNVYMLTDRVLERDLRAAARRGVRVRILLTEYPWRGAREVVQEETWCRASAPVTCRFAPARFRYDHAKYVVIDDRRAEIGTANWTWSAFHKNREYLLNTSNPGLVEALRSVFRADWTGKRAGPAPRQRLVLAPGAEGALRTLLKKPGPVAIETEEFGRVEPLISALEAKGKAVRILVPPSVSNWDLKVLVGLQMHGVQCRLLIQPYLHAKLILVGQWGFIGSENLTASSLANNREVGVIFHQKALLTRLWSQFDKDWKRGVRL